MHTIFILSDSPIETECIRRVLDADEFRIIGAASSVRDVVPWSEATPCVVIIGVRDHQDRLIAISETSERRGSPCLVLCEQFDAAQTNDCIDAGATGVLCRDVDIAVFRSALRMVAGGHRVLPQEYSIPSVERRERTSGPHELGLSEREAAVLDGLAAGRSNKAIARNLNISDATVKVHVKAILRKLKVENRTQAALCAVPFAAFEQQAGGRMAG